MKTTNYAVIVKKPGGWVIHSTHPTKSEAQDQADMVRGRVVALAEDGDPADVDHCPACGGDPMACECDTPWSR